MYVIDSPKRQEEAINNGKKSPSSFHKCHGLFYLPTRAGNQRLNVTSEGQIWFIVAVMNDSQDYKNGTYG